MADPFLACQLSGIYPMDEVKEPEENLEPEVTGEEQLGEKPIWAKLENCLSGCLALIILVALPFIFWYVILPLLEVDPSPNQKTQQEIRQEALEENWNLYLDRANADGRQIQKENFELGLCPFSSDDTWSHPEEPEEVGFICGDITVPLDHHHPTGETIQIPIAIWPVYGERVSKYPLFFTHGGPGGSALEVYPSYLYPDKLGEDRDIVFIDQRGTRYAQPNLDLPRGH